MNDILSIVVAGIFSCIILDVLGYLLKLIGIPEPSWGIVGRWTYYMIRNGAFQGPEFVALVNFVFEVLRHLTLHILLSHSYHYLQNNITHFCFLVCQNYFLYYNYLIYIYYYIIN